MNDAEFDALLADRMAAQPYIFAGDHVHRDSALSAERLVQIEHEFGLALPTQYKRFLTLHGAGDFACAEIYSPDSASGWNLWSEYEYMPAERRNDFLPFANNGAGDYYGFAIAGGVCSDAVWWSDHESGYSLTLSDHPDFHDFLARVALNQ